MLRKFTFHLNLLIPPLFLLLGIAIGWAAQNARQPTTSDASQKSSPLRLAGYSLVSPLLLCDSGFTGNAQSLGILEKKLQESANRSVESGAANVVSVYFRDLNTGSEININGNEKYFPASLKKVPMMMQYYKRAESDPALLSTKGVLTGSVDLNGGVEIKPSQTPSYGQSYSVDELISLMIKYSDNISFQMLSQNMSDSDLSAVYRDLQVRYSESNTSAADFMTPYQFSLFLRTLYNATYLDANYSQKALTLLSQSDFKDGLVAGVPSNVTIAHKFGVLTQHNGDVLLERELHDCGIVFDATTPYLMCVMTKSNGELSQAERVIADLSAIAYKEMKDGYK